MKVVSLFSGVGGLDKGFEDAGCEIVCQVEIEPFCQAVLRTRWPNVRRWSDIKTFSASLLGCPAKTGPLPVSAKESQDSALDSFISLRESCKNFDPLGLSSRMFPDFSVPTTEETLRKCSGFSWSSAGMGFNGVCSTRNFSESPKDAAGCSLSEVLESHVPRRFFLTPRAARGILRRAEKRGRTLPSQLQAALESLATSPAGDGKMTSISPTAYEKNPGGIGQGHNTTFVASTLRESDGHHGRSSPRGDGCDNIVAQAMSAKWAKGTSGPAGDEHHNLVALPLTGHSGWCGEDRDTYVAGTLGSKDGGGRSTDLDGHGAYVRAEIDAHGMRGATEFSEGLDDSRFELLPQGLDSARYRALGNAVTVAVANWIARRILTVESGR